MSVVLINDIFDELNEENRRLKKCLNVFIKFKDFVDSVFNKFEPNFDSNVSQEFKKLNEEVFNIIQSNNLNSIPTDLNPIREDNKQTVSSVEEPQIHIKTEVISGSTDPMVAIDSRKQIYKCESIGCNKEYKTEMSYNIHRRFTHGMTVSMPQSLLKKTNQSNKRTKPVNGQFVCEFVGCGHKFAKRTELHRHRILHRPQHHVCQFDGCDFQTYYKSRLINHINRHNNVRPFKCQFCDSSFFGSKNLGSHLRYMHKVCEEPIVCGIDGCKQEFKKLSELFRHKSRDHTKEAKYLCDFPNCNYKYNYPGELKIHRIKHSKDRPFKCDIDGCSAAFKTMSTLKSHYRSHVNNIQFECTYEGCHKAYKTQKGLEQHIQSIHLNIKHSCDWPGCEFQTSCMPSLNKHKWVHKNERNYLCDWPQCGKAFKQKYGLDNHMRIHNDDRKFACSWPGCNYRCTDSGNLCKHRRVHQK